ncbi:MAG: invasion protein [Methylobacter sp.]|nr:MAG: invasion protein [Methylobacter sp.]PPD04831.1 MAG: invasion protein [Methylobacter sp.]PPD22161.1 MAG: invasion protein [Methylobacter sp.]PPD35329.1 MAG: invasion protein [Methylomonas sp.]
MKTLHLLIILLSVSGFIGRVALSELKPEMLAVKWISVSPHILNALLLLTGFILVFQGDWLAGDYGWIVAKIVALVVYIGLGLMALKQQGTAKWAAFAGALLCVAYIGMVAVKKDAWFFL